MHRTIIAALPMWAWALGGCAAPPSARSVADELGPVPTSAARVCVVRPSAIARDVTMELRDNGRLVSATRGNTFACWLAAPGAHQITSVDDDTGPTYLKASAGRQYWLHQDVTTLDAEVHAHLDWMDESTASELMSTCRARVLVNVPGHDDRPDAVAIAPARL